MSELYWDPWGHRLASYPDYALALWQQVKLAQTRRYRVRRLIQRLTGSALDPSWQDLWRKLQAVGVATGRTNPFDFGPIAEDVCTAKLRSRRVRF